MITFWLIAGVMLVIALLLLARPMLSGKDSIQIDRSEQNLLIAEERMQVAETDFADGELTEDEYRQLKIEIEKTLADELSQAGESKRRTGNSAAIGTAAIGVMLPIFGLAMYALVGHPDFIDETPSLRQPAVAQHSPSGGQQAPSIDQMVDSLAQKLQENPDNIEGWFLLGKSLMSMGRYEEAEKAFTVVNEKLPEPQSGVLLALANAVAMNQKGRISGRPAELVKQALELDPESPTALWLSGMAAEEAGDYETALSHWQNADPLLAGDPANQAELRSMMREVAGKLGRTLTFNEAAPETFEVPKAAAPSETATPSESAPSTTAAMQVSVRVSIAPEALSQVSPEDTVFIFAKAVQGPPMPLAAVRKQVKDLPVEITLDDSMAMMPQMKISTFDSVNVSAKVSKSGNAGVSEGDRNSDVVMVTFPADDSVELVIQ